ncbi:phospholipase A(1) DAD1 [Hibiscus syriacus]|uniref:Phospholipase A(1) DAD1 n=1 Tax=Hibiscus syriacus TaxID=106335 RepID=A0A6A2ZZP6_HIBSY|nr:RGG repeats nuclear RNA binding protein A-like [Hibiscus syriacus]KAE8697501.1 phospholipase A(1) DAD1 [Hibiscus syriacus]
MASSNPFDLLGDDDTGELSVLIAAQQKPVSTANAAAVPKKGPTQSQAKPQPITQTKQAKLPFKPLPPAQAVREAKTEGTRGGGRGGRGYGRGRGGNAGYRGDTANDENSFSNSVLPGGQGALEDGESGKFSERRGYGGPRPYRGGRRGGFGNGEARDGELPRRVFERHSGTGRGNELKREGSGRGNWGNQTDELYQVTEEANETNKNFADEKPAGEEDTGDANKENPTDESEEKEPEDKEMTLEEYEKVLEKKRKALQALKTEGRKIDAKEFESMKQLSNKKKNDDEVFIKLGFDKDRRKEAYEKEERAKKALSINEFLKPAEGERYYNPSGRGHGRGRGRGSRAFGGGSEASNVAAPSIEDPGQFPTLGGK